MIILHLGTNDGFKVKNLLVAKHLIESNLGSVISSSSVYETSAWGVEDQEDFLNLALIIKTELSPEELLVGIQEIENKMGRIRHEKWGKRVIDIDILFYNQQIIKKANLKIPHPEITNRNFVLIPVYEIAPEFIHPELNKSITTLKDECQDTGEVKLF